MSAQCRTTILGPRLGGKVVAWIKRCGNKTSHESGYCHLHRLVDGGGIRKSGPGART